MISIPAGQELLPLCDEVGVRDGDRRQWTDGRGKERRREVVKSMRRVAVKEMLLNRLPCPPEA